MSLGMTSLASSTILVTAPTPASRDVIHPAFQGIREMDRDRVMVGFTGVVCYPLGTAHVTAIIWHRSAGVFAGIFILAGRVLRKGVT